MVVVSLFFVVIIFLPIAWMLLSAFKDLQKGVSAANSEIYIIKAQTALGKTQQYIEIIKNNPNKKFIIAAPTIKLQLEIAARLLLIIQAIHF